MSQTPYFVKDTTITPHITGCGVLLEVDGLGGSPLYRNHSSSRNVVITCVLKSPGHAEVCDLRKMTSSQGLGESSRTGNIFSRFIYVNKSTF